MKAKQHAKVWAEVADNLATEAEDWAGQQRKDLDLLVLFATEVAFAYQRESDNARG